MLRFRAAVSEPPAQLGGLGTDHPADSDGAEDQGVVVVQLLALPPVVQVDVGVDRPSGHGATFSDGPSVDDASVDHVPTEAS